MNNTKNTKMTWQDFGRALVVTADLDPVYCMLYNAKLPEDVLKRYLLAYWCFYDVGTAARIAEAPNFWESCNLAYTEKWPRGTERRHFRGEGCLNALKSLRSFSARPESIVDYFSQPVTFAEVKKRVESFTGFGPWISWKVADMLERVLGCLITFDNSALSIYSEPEKGASYILYGDFDHKLTSVDWKKVLTEMEFEFADLTAPPRHDRPLSIAEYETILCKSKSHVNGHYTIGKDSYEIFHALERVKDVSKLAAQLLENIPGKEEIANLHKAFVILEAVASVTGMPKLELF